LTNRRTTRLFSASARHEKKFLEIRTRQTKTRWTVACIGAAHEHPLAASPPRMLSDGRARCSQDGPAGIGVAAVAGIPEQLLRHLPQPANEDRGPRARHARRDERCR